MSRRKKTDSTVKSETYVLKKIVPITEAQAEVFEEYESNQNLVLMGSPGTGKTFLAIYLALKEIFSEKSKFKKVVLTRSIVPTRNIGFLPGNITEKTEVYEAPYKKIVTDLCGRGDAYDILKKKGVIEFLSTSFCRGLTIDDSIVICDEFSNFSFHELDTIITRLGDNSKVIFSGDILQSDFTKDSEKNGVEDFLDILEEVESFSFIQFEVEDIVRSGLVKEYMLAKHKKGKLC